MESEERDNPAGSRAVVPAGREEGDRKDRQYPLVLTFDCHLRPFVVFTHHCDSPACDCGELTLSFLEFEKERTVRKDPIRIVVHLDLDTWEERREGERSSHVQRIVDEFLTNLSGDLKRWFREDYEAGRDHVRRATSYSAPVEDILEGRLIPFGEVFDAGGSIVSGGSSASFEVDLDGVEYIVEDLYCPDPLCGCNKVELVFLRREKRALVDHFTATMSFKGGVSNIQTSCCTKAEARRLVSMWRQREPDDLLDELRWRYEDIKKVGARILADEEKRLPRPRTSGKRTGRNSPCPCGSGRKYKKCCGRVVEPGSG